MKKRYLLSTMLVLLFFVFSACNNQVVPQQEEKASNSVLWKLEGKNIQPSYILGTIHLLPQSDFEITDAVLNAFNETEQVVFELDMDDPNLQTTTMKYMMMEEGESLADYLTPRQYKSLDSLMKEQGGMGLQFFEKMKPIVLSTFLTVGLFGEEIASFEQSLTKMAKDAEKEIIGLESVEEQMQAISDIPIEDQVRDLMVFVSHQDSIKKIYSEMIRLYKKPDVDSLVVIIDSYYEDYESLKLMEGLLFNRNENWKTRIPKLCKEKPTLVAVGAGHLGGDKGIIKLLQEEGYTLTPIN